MKEALVSNVKWYDNFYDDLYCYKYIFILFENFLNALKNVWFGFCVRINVSYSILKISQNIDFNLVYFIIGH